MKRQFVVVLRASGAIRVREDEAFEVGLETEVGAAVATFRTRYADEGHASPIPRELWIDVRGEANCDIDAAINAYWNRANQTLPSLAVACNAPEGDAEVHLALGLDPHGTEHEFFENFQPDEFGRPRHGRSLSLPETAEFLDALLNSPNSARLLRACAFYRDALNYLKPGLEVMHVSFLWMAVEALTKVALRRACEKEVCSENELVERWGLVPNGADEDQVLKAKRRLDGEARRRLIFHADVNCQRAAVRASDGFEHGYEDFGTVRTLAQEAATLGIAAHVRRAILELAEVSDTTVEHLTTGRFEKPRANWPITKYIRGTFIGPASDLPAPGQEYPMLHWDGEIKEFRRTDAGHAVTFNESVTVVAAEGIEFWPGRFEVYGPENDPVLPPSGEASSTSSGDR